MVKHIKSHQQVREGEVLLTKTTVPKGCRGSVHLIDFLFFSLLVVEEEVMCICVLSLSTLVLCQNLLRLIDRCVIVFSRQSNAREIPLLKIGAEPLR